MTNRALLLLLVTILLAASQSVAAAGSCPIKSAPDEKLVEYLKGVDTILNKATEAASKGSCKDKGQEGEHSGTSDATRASKQLQRQYEQSTALIVESVNKGMTIWNATTSFKMVTMAVNSEIPPAIRRDNSLINAKQQSIMAAIEASYAICGDTQEFPIEGFPFPDYILEKPTVGSILWDLLADHAIIAKRYREIVIGEGEGGYSPAVSMIPTGFFASLEKSYGNKALQDCLTADDDSSPWSKVKTAIEKIGTLGGIMGDGVENWKEAFKLLDGKHEKKDKIEKELLRAELAKQGLNTSQSESMIKNLEPDNTGGGWKGFSSSVENVGAAVQKGVDAVKDLYKGAAEVADQYGSQGGGGSPKSDGQPDPNTSKNADEYVERYANLKNLKTDVGAEITAQYAELEPSLNDDTVSIEKSYGQIIEMHVILSKTLKNIEPFKKKAYDACMAQAENMGGECGSYD